MLICFVYFYLSIFLNILETNMAELTSKIVKHYNLNPCNEVNRLYNEAVATGFAPGSCCKVQFLGDARVGKTSLRKKLMGETFDPDEPETFGIDTKMCNVRDVNENWEERDHGETEIHDCISWFYRNKVNVMKTDSKSSTQQEMMNLALGMIFIATFECILWICAFLDFPVSNKMCILVWISCAILLITEDVALYLTIKGMSHTLFTMTTVMNLLFTTSSALPNFARIVVAVLIAFLQGTVAPCDTRMGQSVALAWTLIFIPADGVNTFNEWIKHCDLSLGIVVFFITLGMLPATYPTNHSFIAQAVSYLMNHPPVHKHKQLITSVGVLVSFAFLLLFPMFYELQTPLMLFVLGLCTGIGDKIGLGLGHRFMNSKLCIDNILTNRYVWYCIIMVYSLVLVTLCYGKTSFQSDEIFLNIILSMLPLLIGEWRRNQLFEYSLKVADVARQVEQTTGDAMPLKLSLWDFAGQELYYNTHHTFISEHAIFVVVFDLVSFINNPTLVCERIEFWVDSVKQHTSDASIILVGTHIDHVDDIVREKANNVLKNYLDTSNIIFNEKLCYFAIDNTNSTEGQDDVVHLRTTIRGAARGMKHVSQEYPIKWRRFLNFIKERRSQSSGSPLIEVSELERVMHEFQIYSSKELVDALNFFHKRGDIFYDAIDTFLRQYVAPDQQVIIDIMQSLVSLPDTIMTRFYAQCKMFQETGSLSYELLHSIIALRLNVTEEKSIRVIIRMLQEKDLIFKIQSSKNVNKKHRGNAKHTEEMFVVPSLLPSNLTNFSEPYSWTKHYYIDFGQLLPDAVFLRLLSRCALKSGDFLSDLSTLSKQGGIFSLGEDFRFQMRKMQPSKQQNVVEISVKVVHDGCPLEVLKYLCDILDMLRCRDFPNLHFKAGPLCMHDEPHQGCRYQGMLHIIDISGELLYTGVQMKRIDVIKRQCNGRKILINVAEFVSFIFVLHASIIL